MAARRFRILKSAVEDFIMSKPKHNSISVSEPSENRAGLVRKIDKEPKLLDIRKDFPALQKTMNGKPLAFLDSGASAQKPTQVIRAMQDIYEQGYSNIHRGLYQISQQLTHEFEQTRQKVAQFMGASSSNSIVFTRNATEGINLVAQSWGREFLSEGDEIILSEMEHHANIVPWQILAEQIGVKIKYIPLKREGDKEAPTGELDIAALEDLLGPKTKLVSIVHISNALGTINDVKNIIAQCKNYNKDIKTLIDGSQAIVHQAVDVEDLGCDFYVFTGHKLYGPTGIGILYGQEDILNMMSPYQGGGDMIERVSLDKTEFKKAPYKFEAGTPAIVEVIGLGAAIDYVQSTGLDNIQAHEHALLLYALQEMQNIDGLKIYGHNFADANLLEHKKSDHSYQCDDYAFAGIISFSLKNTHHSDIGVVLDQCGVAVRAGHHCCMPLMDALGIQGTVRASLAAYNNYEDIDQCIEGLKKAKELFDE